MSIIFAIPRDHPNHPMRGSTVGYHTVTPSTLERERVKTPPTVHSERCVARHTDGADILLCIIVPYDTIAIPYIPFTEDVVHGTPIYHICILIKYIYTPIYIQIK
jgi:hypothetical protein